MTDFSKYKTEVIVLKMGFLGLAEEATASYEVILGMSPAVSEENNRRAQQAWMEALIGFTPLFMSYLESKYTPEELDLIMADIGDMNDETRQLIIEILREFGIDENGQPLDE